jgi:hypothetical protein
LDWGLNSLSLFQRFPDARLVGFDVADNAVDHDRHLVGTEAHQVDLTEGKSLGVQADVAMVVGGLDRCVSNLVWTFQTIAGLLNPGGLLWLYDPNARFFLESARRRWYRLDGYFDAETEHARDHAAILRLAGPRFAALDCVYGGGPAYLLILDSLALRLPLGLKRRIAHPLVLAVSLYSRLPGTSIFPVFIARWWHLGDGEPGLEGAWSVVAGLNNWNRWGGYLIAGIAVAGLAYFADWAELAAAFRSADLAALHFAAAVLLACYLAFALRWRALLNAGRGLPLGAVFAADVTTLVTFGVSSADALAIAIVSHGLAVATQGTLGIAALAWGGAGGWLTLLVARDESSANARP